MAGITDIGFLTRPVRGDAGGDLVINPPTAAEELGISTNPITTFRPGEYLKNLTKGADLAGASEQANQFAVDQVTNQLAEELKSQGYKIDIDWKGIKNSILGRDAKGNPKPMKSPKQARRDFMKVIDKTPAGFVRKHILSSLIKSGIKFSSPIAETIQEFFTSEGSKPTNIVELQEKVNNVKNAVNDPATSALAEKANRGFTKLTNEEKDQLATQFSEIVFDPANKKALYNLLSAQGKKMLSNHAKEKGYITGKELKNLDTTQRDYNPKSIRKDQAIINAYQNLVNWKETEAGKLDPTGRTLSGPRLLEIMAGNDEYALDLFSDVADRGRTVTFLRKDLNEAGLTDISAMGQPIKITEGKSGQQLLEELGLSYFPKNFAFELKGALNESQKLDFDKAVTRIRSAVKEQNSEIDADIGRGWLRTNVRRMIRFALDKDIPMESVMDKVNSFDADGIADILIRKEKYNNKIKEWKELGYDVDFAEIGHIKAAAEDALLSLDLDNLTLQYAKSNKLEDSLRKQIKDVIKNGKKSKYNINDINAQLEHLGIETKVGEDLYGKARDVEDELRQLEIGAGLQEAGIPYAKGGLVGINQLIRPIGNF